MAAIAQRPGKPDSLAAWHGFQPGLWQKEINVRDFIQLNYTPYEGDELFLAGPDPAHENDLWNRLNDMFVEERHKGVLDVSQIPSSITAHAPGYIDRDNEIIVGLQTDAPLKRAIMPNGGLRMVVTALKAYGYEPDPARRRNVHQVPQDAQRRRVRCLHRRRAALPQFAYSDRPARRLRPRPDHRRLPACALYGVARLIEHKQEEKRSARRRHVHRRDHSRPRGAERTDSRPEGTAEDGRQLRLRHLASRRPTPARPSNGSTSAISAPSRNRTGQPCRWAGRPRFSTSTSSATSRPGVLSEAQAQEIVDDFVIKLRIVRFLRTPEYDELFAGDPTWVTESIGGMGDDGRTLVTKSSFRFLQTLYNLGPAPEPNLTIWYSPRMPAAFRHFAAKVAIDTSAIQFESDEIMRRAWGDDGAIACCVSPMLIGKQMQFFGARANLAKCLLYAINGGRDEISGEQVGPALGAVEGDYLAFDDVIERFEKMMDWLAGVYVNAMNIIHYMHDKYAYERLEMALHDYAPFRTMAFGMAGMSVVADSLSAIRHAKVRVVRDATGLITDYEIEGEFPKFGNNDNHVDHLAAWVVTTFMNKLRKYPTYRHALHTQSILTITSNVVYGKATGNTPDGRRRGEPFAPGANPMQGRDTHGMHAAAASVAKIPYRDAQDGISLTASLVPQGLGRVAPDRIANLTGILDAFFGTTGFHMNINVLNRDTLVDAMDHPENYPNLTIRVSGYAVNFVRLTREQQMDVINRTFHGS